MDGGLARTVVYCIPRIRSLPEPSVGWNDPAWSAAEPLSIASFHPHGSSHKPRTDAMLLHDGKALALMFRTEDRYVLAHSTAYQSPTHREACVEAFFRPLPEHGYFNFEFNALGTLLLWYIDKPRRADGGFESYVEVPEELARGIAISASLTQPIAIEHAGPLTWTVSCRIPMTLFADFVGPLGDLSGQRWRANFYKCADDCSHPHWGSWAPIGERRDFHQPERFGELRFE
jgi:hypothetical protein